MRIFVLLFTLLTACFQYSVYCDDTEPVIKADFLERFTRFVEWPKDSRVNDVKKPFIIGITEDNPYASLLKKIYFHQKIKKKSVRIFFVKSSADLSDCDMLFTLKPFEKLFPDTTQVFSKQPVLIISDVNDSDSKLYHINMSVTNKKLHFKINLKEAKKAGLSISHLLLKEAIVVE